MCTRLTRQSGREPTPTETGKLQTSKWRSTACCKRAHWGPEDIDRLVTAYEETLKALELSDRSDPITHMVARKIIELGQTGVRDPHEISALAITAFAPASRA
jgi:hypothetical protein